MWSAVLRPLGTASAFVTSTAASLSERVASTLSEIDREMSDNSRLLEIDEQLSGTSSASTAGDPTDPEAALKELLAEFQLEQLRLCREYQRVVSEKEADLRDLREKLSRAAAEGKESPARGGDGDESGGDERGGDTLLDASRRPADDGFFLRDVEQLRLQNDVLAETVKAWERKLHDLLREKTESSVQLKMQNGKIKALETELAGAIKKVQTVLDESQSSSFNLRSSADTQEGDGGSDHSADDASASQMAVSSPQSGPSPRPPPASSATAAADQETIENLLTEYNKLSRESSRQHELDEIAKRDLAKKCEEMATKLQAYEQNILILMEEKSQRDLSSSCGGDTVPPPPPVSSVASALEDTVKSLTTELSAFRSLSSSSPPPPQSPTAVSSASSANSSSPAGARTSPTLSHDQQPPVAQKDMMEEMRRIQNECKQNLADHKARSALELTRVAEECKAAKTELEQSRSKVAELLRTVAEKEAARQELESVLDAKKNEAELSLEAVSRADESRVSELVAKHEQELRTVREAAKRDVDEWVKSARAEVQTAKTAHEEELCRVREEQKRELDDARLINEVRESERVNAAEASKRQHQVEIEQLKLLAASQQGDEADKLMQLLKDEHGKEIQYVKGLHAEEIESLRRSLNEEHLSELAALRRSADAERSEATAALNSSLLSRHREELNELTESLNASRKEELAALSDSCAASGREEAARLGSAHSAEITRLTSTLKAEHQEHISALTADFFARHEAEKSELISSLESRRADDVASLTSANDTAMRSLSAEHERALRDLTSTLESKHEKAQRDLSSALESKHERSLLDLTSTLDSKREDEVASIQAANAASVASLTAASEAAVAALREEISTLQASHQKEIARMNEEFDLKTTWFQSKMKQMIADFEEEKSAEKEKNVAAVKLMVEQYETVLEESQSETAKAKADLETVEQRYIESQRIALEQAAALAAADKKAAVEAMRLSLVGLVEAANAERDQCKDLYKKEAKRRKEINNILVDMKGAIRVSARVRPAVEAELASGDNREVIKCTSGEELVVQKDVATKTKYEFDNICDQSSTQQEAYEGVADLIVSALDGYNVCIFAYGQTGSGKTYTMEGPEDNRGINYRAIEDIFRIGAERSEDVEYTFSMSMLEIYNDLVRDVLQKNTDATGQPRSLDIRQTPDKGIIVQDLFALPVTTADHVFRALKTGSKNRSVGSHSMNSESSRSHLILTVNILAVDKHNGVRSESKIHLIDLAGSERVSKTNASGDRLAEGQSINLSLTTLGTVIEKLATKASHIPYRDSKLTWLLSESLGGSSKVMMFVNISPVSYNVGETICSLNFAKRCRQVSLGVAKKNDDAKDKEIKKLRDVIRGAGISLP